MSTQDRCPYHDPVFDGHASAIIAHDPDLMSRAYSGANAPVVDFLEQWTRATGCTRMMSARAMEDYCEDPRQHQVARRHALVFEHEFPEGNG